MNDEKNITRGGLSGKMGGYRPDPPQSVWEGVAAGLRGKRSGRKILLFLGAAAGLALAVTVGITLITGPEPQGIATLEEPVGGQSSAVETPDPQAAEANAPGRSHPRSEEEQEDAGNAGLKTTKTRPGNGSRLEQKVVTVMQDVMNEQPATNEIIAGRTGAEQPAMEEGTVRHSGHPKPGNKEAEPGQAGEDQAESGRIGNEFPKPGKAGESEAENGTSGSEAEGQMNAESSGPGVVPENSDAGQQGEQGPAGKLAENTGEQGIKEAGQVPADSGDDRQVVNEDSLVRLLKEDLGESGEPEMDVPGERHPGKWQLGATVSPLISYRDVAAADATQNVAVNHSESARLTYTAGLGVSYLPSDRFTIQTGIYYNKMGVNIGEYSSFKSGWFESQMDMVSAPARSESVVSISNSMGTVISGDAERFVNNYRGTETLTDYHMLTPEEMIVADASVESFSQTFEYLEIPFNVRYKILDRTIDLQLMGGFSTNLLVNNSVAAIAGEETVAIGKVEDVRMFNYTGNAGLGIVYDLFKNFSFSVEPRFRYYLNSINTSELPVTRPYAFGFYTGMNYKF